MTARVHLGSNTAYISDLHRCPSTYLLDNVHVCRDFVHNTYQELKKANPTLPILIRECSGIQARMIARYGKRNADRSQASLLSCSVQIILRKLSPFSEIKQ